MPTPPLMLDGQARAASLFLTVHEAFRRDAARFTATVGKVTLPDRRLQLALHWDFYKGMLISHHTQEDTNLFPELLAEAPRLAVVVNALEAEHDELHALLDDVTRLIPALPATSDSAMAAFDRLQVLLEVHLGREEEHLVPVMEDLGLAPTGDDNGADDGYVPAWWEPLVVPWAADGLDANVVDAIFTRELAEALRTHEPAYAQHAAATWDDHQRQPRRPITRSG